MPKGVVYTHRSLYLHTLMVTMADTTAICESDRILSVVPLFHANAWGMPHAAVATGAELVMPGPGFTPPLLAKLIEEERVTFAAGVPTIWMGSCVWGRKGGGEWEGCKSCKRFSLICLPHPLPLLSPRYAAGA